MVVVVYPLCPPLVPSHIPWTNTITTTTTTTTTTTPPTTLVHAKMGTTTGWGGATRLTKTIGRRKALLALGTAMPLPADHCLSIGKTVA